MEGKTTLSGIIICGGKSSRMGTDKSLLDLNGLKYYEHVRNILAEFCEEVFISCRLSQISNYNLPAIADKYEDRGPMAGVLSCMEELKNKSILTLPCDMPFLDPEILKQMILLNKENIDGIFIRDASGQIEPMLGLYNPSLFPALISHFNLGGESLKHFIGSCPNIRFYSVDNYELINVNTPEDHKKLSGG